MRRFTVASAWIALVSLALIASVPLRTVALAQDSTDESAANDDSSQVLELPQVFTPAQQSCANAGIASSANQNCPPVDPSQADENDVQQYASQGQPADASAPSGGDLNAYVNQGTAAEGGAMGSPYGVGAPVVLFPSYWFYGFGVPSSRPAPPRPIPRPHGGGPHHPHP